MNDDLRKITDLEYQLLLIQTEGKRISEQMDKVSETLLNLSTTNRVLWQKHNEILDQLKRLKG